MGFVLIFLGSGIGGVMRHGVGLLSLRWLGSSFPYGTLTTNVVGSAMMGLVVGLFATVNLSCQDARLFLTTGIIGGFTTFSTFSLDTVTLWERGQTFAAVGYVLGSIALSTVALTAGLLISRRII